MKIQNFNLLLKFGDQTVTLPTPSRALLLRYLKGKLVLTLAVDDNATMQPCTTTIADPDAPGVDILGAGYAGSSNAVINGKAYSNVLVFSTCFL